MKDLPVGVNVNMSKTSNAQPGEVYLDIDSSEYSDPLSQVGIINWCELGVIQLGVCAYYSADGQEYLAAEDFRERYGFDNTFFESREK